MTAQELFTQLRTQGATLTEREGRLLVAPRAVAEANAEQIRSHKLALLWLVRKKHASTVIASEWPTICVLCEQWQEIWELKQGLYRCQYCGHYFRFQPKEQVYETRLPGRTGRR